MAFDSTNMKKLLTVQYKDVWVVALLLDESIDTDSFIQRSNNARSALGSAKELVDSVICIRFRETMGSQKWTVVKYWSATS